MSLSWQRVAASCGVQKPATVSKASTWLQDHLLHDPIDADGLTDTDVDRMLLEGQLEPPVIAAVRKMIAAAKGSTAAPSASSTPANLKPAPSSSTPPRVSPPPTTAPAAKTRAPSGAAAVQGRTPDSFYQVAAPRQPNQAADQPRIACEPISDPKLFPWTQADIQRFLHEKFSTSLRQEGVLIKQDELWPQILRNPLGLLTRIEWTGGRVELWTRQVQKGQWETGLRKFSMKAMAAERADVSVRAERWCNVNNLSGWLRLQGEKIRINNPLFTEDDVNHLERQILESPTELSTMIEWTTGIWHLTIRQHGDIWQAKSLMEEKHSADVSAPFP